MREFKGICKPRDPKTISFRHEPMRMNVNIDLETKDLWNFREYEGSVLVFDSKKGIEFSLSYQRFCSHFVILKEESE